MNAGQLAKVLGQVAPEAIVRFVKAPLPGDVYLEYSPRDNRHRLMVGQSGEAVAVVVRSEPEVIIWF